MKQKQSHQVSFLALGGYDMEARDMKATLRNKEGLSFRRILIAILRTYGAQTCKHPGPTILSSAEYSFRYRRLDAEVAQAKAAQAKLYTTKPPITAADMLNDKVLPFYEENDLPVLRILTDRGTGYCGRADKHDVQLFLAIKDIDHAETRVKHP